MAAPDEFDLGELRPATSPGSRGPRGRPEPLGPPDLGAPAARAERRLTDPRTWPWRPLAAAAALSLLVGAVAWQAGADRARDEPPRPVAAAPPLLAWLTAGPPSGRTKTVVVHVANLGSAPIHVQSVRSDDDPSGGTVTATLRAAMWVSAGVTQVGVVDLLPECRGDYRQAGLDLAVTYTDPGPRGATHRSLVATRAEGAGRTFPTLLNQACSGSVRFNHVVRVSGLQVEVPQVGGLTTQLVLTNRARTLRAVQVIALGDGPFRITTDPATPLLVKPGQRVGLTVRVGLATCRGIEGGESWADDVQLQVARLGEPQDEPQDPDDPDAVSLYDAVYPLVDSERYLQCDYQ